MSLSDDGERIIVLYVHIYISHYKSKVLTCQTMGNECLRPAIFGCCVAYAIRTQLSDREAPSNPNTTRSKTHPALWKCKTIITHEQNFQFKKKTNIGFFRAYPSNGASIAMARNLFTSKQCLLTARKKRFQLLKSIPRTIARSGARTHGATRNLVGLF